MYLLPVSLAEYFASLPSSTSSILGYLVCHAPKMWVLILSQPCLICTEEA